MTQDPPKHRLDLTNKIALVSGGNSGIGKATAQALAAAGAKVAIGARRADAGQAVVNLIQEAGGEAVFIPTDLTQEGAAEALVQQSIERFGGLHIAFNNAGIEGDGMLPIVEEDEANLRRIMEVNFFGLWRSLRAQLRHMAEHGGGSIINNSSVAGLKGFGNFSSYVASKFAVEGLSRSVAHEGAAAGVRVNTVAPGPIATPMLDRTTGEDHEMFTQFVPLGRAGQPEEIANLVLFLASDASSYINGHFLRADGGMMA